MKVLTKKNKTKKNIIHKTTQSIVVLTTLVTMAACHQKTSGRSPAAQITSVEMRASSDSAASGEVRFTDNKGLVSMEAQFSGLKPGPHAIHIHAHADCSADDGKSAGGHWNPTDERHGKWGADSGYHKGDIGNFNANTKGLGKISMQTDEWCIACDDASKKLIGKSVIVHQGTDDFISQPSGDAGSRIACGEILN